MEKTKKELREEYKLKKPRMGVFQIRNTTTEKAFIKSSTTLDTVWNSQRFQLEAGGHPNPDLQKDWNTYGADVFAFEILHELKVLDEPTTTDPREELKALEAMTIEEATAPLYNKRA